MTSPFPKTCASLTLALGLATTAYPWASEGHHAMALAATPNLSETARAQVVKILGSDDLSSIAVWMDDVRSAAYHSGPLGSDPEALRFNALFPHNGEWHYVDLPLGVKAYELNGDYERDDDVVHELEAAINVLEGTGDKRISPREALCMVVHFVGDLHQPLHVGNGVFATAADGTARLVEDPVAAKGLPNDKGGNADFFGPGRYDELHGYWDFELVEKIAGSKDPEAVAAVIGKKVSAARKRIGHQDPRPERGFVHGRFAQRIDRAPDRPRRLRRRHGLRLDAVHPDQQPAGPQVDERPSPTSSGRPARRTSGSRASSSRCSGS
jgi:hypothetical protein